MTVQKYSSVASRNLIRAEMEMLRHAEPIMVLTRFGEQFAQPLRKTDTVVFRRIVPFGGAAVANPADGYSETPVITAANFITSEGVTPTANTITYTDISATLQQYAVLFKFTSKTELMYEDDIPGDMVKICGKTMAEIAEKVAYGNIRGGTAVIYANGSARASVNSALSLNTLRLAARSLDTNRATKVTEMIKPGPNFGTSSVEESFPLFVHSHVVADCRSLPGVTMRPDYGSSITPLHEREVCACEDFRIISSPLFEPFLAAGASVTGTGMLSAGASACDIYPCIAMGESAFGHISLKGHGFTGIKPKIISAGDVNHANPVGMFGFVSANFWLESVRLNENFMVRIEVAASALT